MTKLLTALLVFILSTDLFGQSYYALDKALKEAFPENSNKDGRWVYYSDKAELEKLDKPQIKAAIPSYQFYKVIMTNYLGYHVNQGTCVILFDSAKAKIVLVEPLWYGGISESLVKLFIKKRFDSTENLLSFLVELNDLMEIGSQYKFIKTGSSDHLISYDLVYFKGDSYTTGGNGTSSTINHTSDGIWRQIEVKVKDLKLLEYTSINPALKGKKEYSDSYRETIK